MGLLEIDRYRATPIQPKYRSPSQEFIEALKRGARRTLLKPTHGILLDSRYFKMSVRGAIEEMYLRESVLKALEKALSTLQPDYGFVVFDAYRSKQTQGGLFESYFEQIKVRNPSMSEDELHREARKFVAHPDEPSRFEVPPHNSGGAVDIGLTFKGKPTDMGTDFDDLTDKASMDYFERPFDSAQGVTRNHWESVRGHRRILFHSLCSAGFTNWKHEWWHFDLGNCVWSQELKLPWVFGSMETGS